MLRELISKNIFVFSSELYAQVTAGAILTPEGAIVIDTLPFPSESRQIVRFVEERQAVPVRYVINTHYHADHTYGTCFFEDATVISHYLCRQHLAATGYESLKRAQRTSHEMAAVQIRLPDVVFRDGRMSLNLGGVTVDLWHTPGHSLDSIACHVREENILFAADTMTPVPFFADGSWEAYEKTLTALLDEPFESIIQGHGEVILRGEVSSRIKEDIHYLHEVRRRVEKVVNAGADISALDTIEIEDCGKDRIALNGVVLQLHRANLEALYWELLG
nr:MBL fold metallo-hydrolase [Anaerolineae bacterium]